jgi:hypothetical protein
MKKWNNAGSKILPRDVLNNGVTITLSAIEPKKNGKKDQFPCGVPLRRKAGRCQNPQMIPRTRPAHIGANFLCRRGRANPLQPNSSIGPFNAVKSNAANKDRIEENGYSSSRRFPFITDPMRKTTGIPIIIKMYQDSEHRHSKNRERYRRNPSRPVWCITTEKAAIAGAYTARKKRGCRPVNIPNSPTIWSGRKMYKARIPHAIPNAISRNGTKEINCICCLSVCDLSILIFDPR